MRAFLFYLVSILVGGLFFAFARWLGNDYLFFAGYTVLQFIVLATASLAGAFLIIIQPVEPSVGREYIGRVFAICVLGGLQSLPGTVIAAMLLGVVESLTATFSGPSWAPAVSFGFLLLTLAFRPAGLLGR